MGTMPISAPSITPLYKPLYFKGKQSIDSRTQIEITCDSPSAVIYFSVNGRTPDPFETWNLNTVTMRYTKPFVLKGSNKPRTVKAVAVIEKLKQKSPVVTKSFNVAAHPASPKQRKRMSIVEINNDGENSGNVLTHPNEENPAEIDIRPIEEQENKEQEVFDVEESGIAEEAKIESNELPCAEAEKGNFNEISEKDDRPADSSSSLVQQEEKIHDINDANELDNEHVECAGKRDNDGLPETELEINERLTIQDETAAEMQSIGLIPVDVNEPLDVQDPQTDVHCDNQEKPSDTQNYTNLISKNDSFDSPPIKLPVTIERADKDIQVAVDTELKATQTDPVSDQPKALSRNPPLQRVPNVQMVSKRVGNELKEESKSCQTLEEEKKECREQECQTNARQQHNAIPNFKHKGSPGRGYWRQQIDHITHQLKTEAYNNLDFQEMISEPSLAQINRINVHEGLDELILVINIAIQRPTSCINN